MTEVKGPLIGRRREVALLAASLEELDGGIGGALHIVGEPGIGKSRLLREVKEQASQRGQLVLSGRATEFERNYPFGIFVDALDRYLASLDPGWIESRTDEKAHELAAIFPSLSSPQDSKSNVLQAERFHAHDAVRVLLEQLAGRQPVVLALDDVQWADAASVELLSHLLRHAPEGRVLILLAYRPRQASPQLAAALEAVKGERSDGHAWRALELGPLSAQECELLLSSQLDGATKERLFRESGGNPFYLEQLVRTEARGVAGGGDGLEAVDRTVPVAVGASIAGELAMLSEPGHAVLEAAAVVGEPFDPRVAAAVAEMSEGAALEALDELVDLDLVRGTRVAWLFRFRHPIVRRAVYESAKPGWRISAHRRAAEVLRERGAPAVTRADHLQNSASIGDEEAIAVLTEAGHAAAPRAPSAAASWLASALRLLPATGGNVGRRLELLIPMAVALGSVGRLEESRSALRQVLELLPPEASALRARVVYSAATVELLLDNHDIAEGLLLEALSELPDQGTPEAARLKYGLALSSSFSSDWRSMRSWARRAIADGRGLAPAERATGLSALALAEYGLLHTEEARRHTEEAAGLVDRLSDSTMITRSETILYLGWAEHCLGRNEDAERHMDRALALSRTSGQGHLVVWVLLLKSGSLAWRGRLGEAATHAQHAIESALLSTNDLLMSWAFATGCFVEMLRGELRSAIRYGEQAVAAGASFRSPSSLAARWFLGEAWFELGEAARCREVLFAPGAEEPTLVPFPLHTARSFEILTRMELERGNLEAAERWSRRAERSSEELGVPGQLAEGRRARAALLLARGRWEEAAATAIASAAAAEQAGAPVEAARSRMLAGRALAEDGNRDQALEQLARAEAELSACGALRYREQAAHELRRLGHRVAPAATQANNGQGALGLTPRQLEVAELVTEGKTNREIAGHLFLSEKGVESHLRRIFDKLDVRSRTAVAAMVERTHTPSHI
ncbi:MAG: AAA family ATPase [Actinomycetota bacterium]|nr:AAA family ATPase [Actinomycetota bacterium]